MSPIQTIDRYRPDGTLRTQSEIIEEHARLAVEELGGNYRQVALALGVGRSTIYRGLRGFRGVAKKKGEGR